MKKKARKSPTGSSPRASRRMARRAPSATTASLAARIERLESIEEIRMLVAKYSLSLDMRDLDAHVNLLPPISGSDATGWDVRT